MKPIFKISRPLTYYLTWDGEVFRQYCQAPGLSCHFVEEMECYRV